MKVTGEINVNTLITAATLLVTGALAFATLDKRITILEEVQKDKLVRVEEQLKDVQKDIKQLTQIVNSLSRKDRE